MIEILILLACGLIGWLLSKRQQPTEPPILQPKKPEKYDDRIDEITQKVDAPVDHDNDALARILDERLGGK